MIKTKKKHALLTGDEQYCSSSFLIPYHTLSFLAMAVSANANVQNANENRR